MTAHPNTLPKKQETNRKPLIIASSFTVILLIALFVFTRSFIETENNPISENDELKNEQEKSLQLYKANADEPQKQVSQGSSVSTTDDLQTITVSTTDDLQNKSTPLKISTPVQRFDTTPPDNTEADSSSTSVDLEGMRKWRSSFRLKEEKSYPGFKAWESKYGKKIDFSKWMKTSFSPEPMRPWLGPLGVKVQLWPTGSWAGRRYVNKYRKAVSPFHGALSSQGILAVEVLKVNPDSPAAGKLKKGDIIYEVDNQRLLPPEIALKHKPGSVNKVILKSRCSEIHLGQLIDAAEGRGVINLKVLRKNSKEWPQDFSVSQEKNAKLPKVLTPLVKSVDLSIPKIGSFGDSFDPNCEKARNYSKILAKRLILEQKDDGSFHGGPSYCKPAFHTSLCGLGLMSTGDPNYSEAIKRAAHYVAYGDKAGKVYAMGITVLFLAEYYLRTEDNSILPALEYKTKRLTTYLMYDYLIGQGAGPAYDGRGWLGATGPFASGLTVASFTPIKFDRTYVDNMLHRISQISPYGCMPYGRLPRVRGNEVTDLTYDRSKKLFSQTCGNSLCYIAAKIRGGVDSYVRKAENLYSEPNGAIDFGHATQTLPFIFGSIAIANISPEMHKKNMDLYLWWLTTHRDFTGLINVNTPDGESGSHGGEKALGNPGFSTGGYLILMNAHKRNLAITGLSSFTSEKNTSDKSNSCLMDWQLWQKTLHAQYLVDEVLHSKGIKSPDLARYIEKLEGLEESDKLGDKVFLTVENEAPKTAQAIAKLKGLSDFERGWCIEKIMRIMNVGGSYHPYYGRYHENLAVQGRMRKKNDGKIPYELRLQCFDMYSYWWRALSKEKRAFKTETEARNWLKKSNGDSKFTINGCNFERPASMKMHGTITITDPSAKVFPKPVTTKLAPTWNFVQGKGKVAIFNHKWKQDSYKDTPMLLKYDYKVAGIHVKYTIPLKNPMGGIPIYGTVVRDHVGWTLPLRLKHTGRVIPTCDKGGYHAEMLLNGKYVKSAEYLLEGAEVKVTPFRVDQIWEVDLDIIKLLKEVKERKIKIESVVMGKGSSGDSSKFIDGSYDYFPIKFNKAATNTVLIIKFSKKEKIHSFYMSSSVDKGAYRFEAMINGKWKKIMSSSPSGKSFFGTLSPAYTDSLRVTIVIPSHYAKKIETAQFNEMRIYKSPTK